MKNLLLLVFCFFVGGWVHAQVEKNVGDFSSLRVSDRIVLDLVQSDENRVEVFGDDAENVVIKNKNGRLVIRMEISKFMQGDKVEATLYFKDLDEIIAANGAFVQNSKEIDFTSLDLTANKGGNIELSVQANSLDAKAASGAQIALSGKTDHFKARINSGGKIDAEDFEADTADLGITAGGDLTAHVATTVEAKINMGGDIYIYGNPEISEKVTAGGKVHHKNKD